MSNQNRPNKPQGKRPPTQGKSKPGNKPISGMKQQGRPASKAPRGARGDQTTPRDTRKTQPAKGRKPYGNIPQAKPFITQNQDLGYEETSRSNRQYGQFARRSNQGGLSAQANNPRRGNQRGGSSYRQQEFASPAAQRFGPDSRPERTTAPAYNQSSKHMDAFVSEDIPQVNLLTGRNPIREAVKSGRDLEKLMIAKGELSGSAREIVSLAKKAGIMIQSVERSRLDQLAKNHQGMIAFASAYQYATVDDILEHARQRGEDPFIIVLDQITDPHNLGAVIRTASCAGAHGVIVPQHRAVGLTPAAVKASAGAVEHIKVARVTNLNQTIKSLQRKGIWFYACETKGEDYRTVQFDGPCALVIGSEGEGISRLTASICDKQIRIPMVGEMDSLNASVAAAILMYAVHNHKNPLN